MTAHRTWFYVHSLSGSLVMVVIMKGKDVSNEITAFWDVMSSMYSGRRLAM